MEGSCPVGVSAPPMPGGMANNGFYNNNNCNGERSRLFQKSNGSKPVREWYV